MNADEKENKEGRKGVDSYRASQWEWFSATRRYVPKPMGPSVQPVLRFTFGLIRGVLGSTTIWGREPESCSSEAREAFASSLAFICSKRCACLSGLKKRLVPSTVALVAVLYMRERPETMLEREEKDETRECKICDPFRGQEEE